MRPDRLPRRAGRLAAVSLSAALALATLLVPGSSAVGAEEGINIFAPPGGGINIFASPAGGINIFGPPPNSFAGMNIFGGPPAPNPFAGLNIFGGPPAPNPFEGLNIFGPPPPPPPPPPPALPDPPSGGVAASAIQVVTPGGTAAIDFPDPSVLYVEDPPPPEDDDVVGTVDPPESMYYAYSTGDCFFTSTVKIIKSPDLITWTQVGDDAFEGLSASAWATLPCFTWAPAVIERTISGERQWVMFYTARAKSVTDTPQCIGYALATTPEGPFTDAHTTPLVCPETLHGAIDPSYVEALDGTPYLLYRTYGGQSDPTAFKLWSAKVTWTGSVATLGTPALLLTSTASEEIIEAPSMMPIGSTAADGYFLFFSVGHWGTAEYGDAVAFCATPTSSECARIYNKPLLTSRSAMVGPGGGSAFYDPVGGAWRFAFHAWASGAVGYDEVHNGQRKFRLLPITIPDSTKPRQPKIG